MQRLTNAILFVYCICGLAILLAALDVHCGVSRTGSLIVIACQAQRLEVQR